MMERQPIGVFDSGIGGLTVLKKLQTVLPHENFVYFADTAHLPYGEKTPEQIIDYARKIIGWMQNEVGVKLVVAACHTSSAIALDTVAEDVSIPVIGTIYPMIETILNNHLNKRIGLIATPASVRSKMHENIIVKAGFKGEFHSISCPNFVPLIENGHIFGPELIRNTTEYLRIFSERELNTLIYGCTHYPLIAETIEQVLPESTEFIDPAEHMAKKVSQELYNKKIINISNEAGKVDFYSSSDPEKLSAQVNLLLSIPKPSVTLKYLSESTETPQKLVVNQ
ncbi:MAG: glutamate racemase [Alphaproteobacteria bacterium]|nr:glutamate racemase [Alphaproteobacteria bacterium]